MGPEEIILVNSLITTFQQSLTHSAMKLVDFHTLPVSKEKLKLKHSFCRKKFHVDSCIASVHLPLDFQKKLPNELPEYLLNFVVQHHGPACLVD